MDSKTIFLAYTSPDMETLREELMFTLFKAGFKVLPMGEPQSNEDFLKNKIVNDLMQCKSSIHLIGAEYGRTLASEGGISLSQYQYNKAKECLQKGNNFRIFVWHPETGQQIIDNNQQALINDLQNNIEANMTYTNTPSSIQLADDLRSMLEVTDKPQLQLNNTEIFFISNLIDDLTAEEITDMLSDVTQIEKLAIEQDSDTDYAELSSQQINKSKLAVVYFKESADWAIPFAQQIWKKVGGAAAQTPILVIGDEDPDTNKSKGFKAPKVISMIMAGELIPLEIKVQYDKTLEAL
jgi:predicted CoA-binding protein